MIKTLKNCNVTIYDEKDIKPGCWALVREQGKTSIEIYLPNLTISKRIESALPKEAIAKRYKLPI